MIPWSHWSHKAIPLPQKALTSKACGGQYTNMLEPVKNIKS